MGQERDVLVVVDVGWMRQGIVDDALEQPVVLTGDDLDLIDRLAGPGGHQRNEQLVKLPGAVDGPALVGVGPGWLVQDPNARVIPHEAFGRLVAVSRNLFCSLVGELARSPSALGWFHGGEIRGCPL